jgi:hypothetical protein
METPLVLGATLVVLAPYLTAEGVSGVSSEVRLMFLAQDATPGGWDHSGCCGYVLEPLQDLFKRRYPSNFVENDVGKLIRNDVPPYYIYNKRYCLPIGQLLGANTFVMTQVRLLNLGMPLEEWRFDVEAKVYSSLTKTESVFFSASDLTFPAAVAKVETEKDEILKELVRVLRRPDG